MTITLSIRGIGFTPHLGDTIWATAVLTDEDGDTLTPDSQNVTLRDPSAAVQDTDVAPALADPAVAGTYESKLVIPTGGTLGLWTVRWIVTVGTDQETEVYRFVVSSLT